MTATLRYTSSPETTRRVMIARVAAAGRVEAERKAAQARLRRELEQGSTEEWCFVCSRAKDHRGEHGPDQVAAWRESPQGHWLNP